MVHADMRVGVADTGTNAPKSQGDALIAVCSTDTHHLIVVCNPIHIRPATIMIQYPVTQSLLDLITTLLTRTGCEGVTSVGCGDCELERRLADVVPAVTGVEQYPCEIDDMPSTYTHVEVRRGYMASIPRNHAILFSYPIDNIPFDRYMAAYTGPCLIMIVGGSCQPDPHEWDGHTIPGWTLIAHELVYANDDDDDEFTLGASDYTKTWLFAYARRH